MRWLLLIGAAVAMSYHLDLHFKATELYTIGTLCCTRSELTEGPGGGKLKDLSDRSFELSRSVELGKGLIAVVVFFLLSAVALLSPRSASVGVRPGGWWRAALRLFLLGAWAVGFGALRAVSYPVHYLALNAEVVASFNEAVGDAAGLAQARSQTSVYHNSWYTLETIGVLQLLAVLVFAWWWTRPAKQSPVLLQPPEVHPSERPADPTELANG